MIARQVNDVDSESLRTLADTLKSRLKSGIVVLAAPMPEGKVSLIVTVTPDLAKKAPAGQLVKTLAPIVGGGGGGRPDFAQAGGKDASKITDLLAAAKDSKSRNYCNRLRLRNGLKVADKAAECPCFVASRFLRSCLATASPAAAQIYSWRDADGKLVLSDTPRAGGGAQTTYEVHGAASIKSTIPLVSSQRALPTTPRSTSTRGARAWPRTSSAR